MKLLTTTLLTSLSLNAGATGFNFKTHVPLFDQQIEYISAHLATPTKSGECMVDTGARFTIGKQAIFADLEKIGEIPGGGLSNTELPTDLVQTDVSVGDWKIQNAILGRTDRIPYECLIGNDFFIGRAFSIDFELNKISEIENTSQLENSLAVYPSNLGGHFGFEVKVADYSTQSIFDTGASHTVIDQKILDLNPTEFKFIEDLNAIDANGKKIQVALYELSQFKFGSIELKNMKVIVVDLSPLTAKIPNADVVFGLDIIQKYNWAFNTQLKTWQHKAP